MSNIKTNKDLIDFMSDILIDCNVEDKTREKFLKILASDDKKPAKKSAAKTKK